MNVAALFAGGIGSRMTSATVPKQFLEIHGKPIIVHTIELFERHPEIEAIAISIVPSWRPELERLIRRFELMKVRWIVDGGDTGQESRHKVLQAIALDCPESTTVLLHDGVRPLINAEIISQNISAVERFGNAITCTKVNETIVSSEDELIQKVIPRETLYAAQAPQSFRLGEVLKMYDDVAAEGEKDSIDTCTLAQKYGHAVHRVEGPRTNIKITTAEDYYVARAYFDLIENRQLNGI